MSSVDVAATIGARIRKWKRSARADQAKDAEYLQRMLDGKPLTGDPRDDIEVALVKASQALVQAAPDAHDDQLAAYLRLSRPGLDLDEAHGLIAMAREHTYVETRGSKPPDAFAVEQLGPRQGRPVVGSQHNFDVALARLGATFHFDKFSRRKIVERAGVREVVEDVHVNGMMFEIERAYDFFPPKDKFHDYCTDLAHRNAFHPVLDYLDEVQPTWDRRPRVETWLIDFGGAVDTPYVRAVSRLVLVAAVRRVRQPGCKFDEMLILEGEQGSLKSSALAALCPKREWFADQFKLDGDPKHFIEQSSGKWILEAAELKGMSAKEDNDLKSQLSTQQDIARKPYQREPDTVPRQCVIVGTTNDAQYLKDLTGARRYWPVAVRVFDIAALLAARDQIWAEAAQLDLAHPEETYIRLDPSLYSAAAEEQDRRRTDDPFQILVEDVLGGRVGRVRIQDVWKVLGFGEDRHPTRGETMQISAAMQALGWEHRRVQVGGLRATYYVRGTEAEREIGLNVSGSYSGWKVTEVHPGPVRQAN